MSSIIDSKKVRPANQRLLALDGYIYYAHPLFDMDTDIEISEEQNVILMKLPLYKRHEKLKELQKDNK